MRQRRRASVMIGQCPTNPTRRADSRIRRRYRRRCSGGGPLDASRVPRTLRHLRRQRQSFRRCQHLRRWLLRIPGRTAVRYRIHRQHRSRPVQRSRRRSARDPADSAAVGATMLTKQPDQRRSRRQVPTRSRHRPVTSASTPRPEPVRFMVGAASHQIAPCEASSPSVAPKSAGRQPPERAWSVLRQRKTSPKPTATSCSCVGTTCRPSRCRATRGRRGPAAARRLDHHARSKTARRRSAALPVGPTLASARHTRSSSVSGTTHTCTRCSSSVRLSRSAAAPCVPA